MTRIAAASTLILIALTLAAAAPAATPGQINYQGLLLDDGGQPVTSNVDLVFTIFDAATGGTSLWTEAHPNVAVLDGVYDVVLGTITPITPAVVAGGALHLQITVEGETLTPRQRLVAVPYALRAAEADSVGGFDAAYVMQMFEHFNFDGGAPANDDAREGLADTDGDGRANFVDADNDADGLLDGAEVAQGSNINLITPTISGISPSSADASAATAVTVTGTNFEPGIAVTFGNASPTPQDLTSSSFSLDVGPQPAGTVTVQVTRTNGEFAQTSFDFVVIPPIQPVIESLTPSFRDAEQTGIVVVAGSGFVPGLQVEFGSETPTPQNLTATSFQVSVGPQPAGAALVRVSYPGGLEDTAIFEFIDNATPKKVFATSTAYSGNLGGIAGADAKCAARASAASLPGTWRAWLGDSTGNPNANFTRIFPYFRVDGTTRVAQAFNDLADGSIENSISRDEFGNAFGGSAIWTNVASDGSAQGSHCLDWSTASSSVTGGIGQALNTNSMWTSAGSQNCDQQRRLYCFQQ